MMRLVVSIFVDNIGGESSHKSHFFPVSGHKRSEVSKRGARIPAKQRYLRCVESARQSRRIYRVSQAMFFNFPALLTPS